jgi:ABC-type transporter Mla maintaining outer membrane lipid asymmetry ATPase subunit MlaF
MAMLYEGRVQWEGTVDEIKHVRDPIVRQFIEGRPTLDEDEPAALAAGSAQR